MELAKNISEMAIAKRLLTVYDIGQGVDLLGVCKLALDGTDIDHDMKLITVGKWRLTELAKGVLLDRPFDQFVQRAKFAKVRTQTQSSSDRRTPFDTPLVTPSDALLNQYAAKICALCSRVNQRSPTNRLPPSPEPHELDRFDEPQGVPRQLDVQGV